MTSPGSGITRGRSKSGGALGSGRESANTALPGCSALADVRVSGPRPTVCRTEEPVAGFTPPKHEADRFETGTARLVGYAGHSYVEVKYRPGSRARNRRHPMSGRRNRRSIAFWIRSAHSAAASGRSRAASRSRTAAPRTTQARVAQTSRQATACGWCAALGTIGARRTSARCGGTRTSTTTGASSTPCPRVLAQRSTSGPVTDSWPPSCARTGRMPPGSTRTPRCWTPLVVKTAA